MDPNFIKNTLSIISKTYREILEPFDMTPIITGIDLTKQAYDLAKRNLARTGLDPIPWGYTIYHDQPLRFRRVQVPNSIELQVDVYCDIRWGDEIYPVKQDIKVRVWTSHNATIYREDMDAEKILELLTDSSKLYPGQRVVSRFHLDLVNPDQRNGPKYHLQLGGLSEEYELCWHPEKVNMPRFAYQPMDLFLACQMIAANFFREEYLVIREKAEWLTLLLRWQNWLLLDYYHSCYEAVRDNNILLDRLWVIS